MASWSTLATWMNSLRPSPASSITRPWPPHRDRPAAPKSSSSIRGIELSNSRIISTLTCSTGALMHLALNVTDIGRQRGGNESYLLGLIDGLRSLPAEGDRFSLMACREG